MPVSLFRQNCRDLHVRFSWMTFLLYSVTLPHFVLFTHDSCLDPVRRLTLCFFLGERASGGRWHRRGSAGGGGTDIVAHDRLNKQNGDNLSA